MKRQMTVAAIEAVLGRVPLFEGLPEEDLHMLGNGASAVVLRRGGRLCEEGALADACFVVVEGRLKVVLSGRAGSEFIIGMLGPSALAGEVALIDGSARSASLVAAEPCRVIRVPKRCFDALRKRPAFEARLLVHVAATLRRATERLRAIYAFDTVDRTLWCLAQLARERGQEDGSLVVITPKPAHQELAEMAGCSRETVTRAFVRLKKLKRLTWDARSLRLDRRFLKSYFPGEEGSGGLGDTGGVV